MMRIIGITCTTKDGTQKTILVRPSIALLNVTARSILPWFFSQAIPLFGVIAENSVSVRVKTSMDPFRHLRRPKSAPFDGKGFTLQRSVRHGGIVHVDGVMKISIDEFNLLCPGLFYGTALYPNLNLLLSQRRFRQHVVSPVMLWSILSDCLFCRQYNDRQRTGDDFKMVMRRKYLATQLKDFRPMIAELEERLKETNQVDQLKNSLQQMIATVHSRQALQHTDEVKQLQRMLASVSKDKKLLQASRLLHPTDTIMEMVQEIVASNLSVMTNELENMLDLFLAELVELRSQLEVQQSFEISLEQLNGNANEMEDMFNRLDALPSLEFELESARCAVENNNSLVLFTKLDDANDRQLYINNLRTHKQILMTDIRSAQEHVELAAIEKQKVIENLQMIKGIYNGSTPTNDPRLDDILIQLQNNINEIVRVTNEMANLEDSIMNLQKNIWHEYAAISSVRFAELVSIAAVKFIVEEEQLEANTRADFLGFIYDRALETGISGKWIEALSCTAIFKTLNSASRVKEQFEQLHTGVAFQYVVLSTRLRTSLNSLLRDVLPQVAIGANYEDMVEKVSNVVLHIVGHLRSTKKLNLTRDRLEHLIASKTELMLQLNQVRSENHMQLPRFSIAQLPKLVKNFINANNYKLRLQARHVSLEKFIHQLETVSPLPAEEQLKSDGLRLATNLKAVLQNIQQNRKLMYGGVKQLTEIYNKLQYVMNRLNDEESCLMAEEGLASSITKKIIDCWTTCSESIRRGVMTVEAVRNKLNPAEEEEPTVEDKELDDQIQSLELREKFIAARVTSVKCMFAEYQQENNITLGQGRRQNSLSRQMVGAATDGLMSKIVRTQEQLRQMHPGYRDSEVAKMKTKLKHLQLLEKIRSNAREMCLNNLILPVIDKLHVQKLRQACQLVACISDDLPELGGIAKVSFGCTSTDREQDEAHDNQPFSMEHINTVNIHIVNDDNQEIDMNEKQRDLAYLVLFLCFLYCDNCKLVMLDKAFEQLLDSGVVSLFHVLEKYFPTMQFIVLDNNAELSE